MYHMPISIRLDKKTESELTEIAKALRVSKAEIIRRSLSEFYARAQGNVRPYDLIKDLLGKEGSGRGDLSIRSEEILRTRLRRKQ